MKPFSRALAVLCASTALAAFAQEGAAPDQRAYRWIEAGYGGQNISDEDGFGATAPGTYRIAANAPIGGPIYLVASYTGANYPFQFLDWLSGGFGVHVPFGPNMHAIAQLTYEQAEVQGFGEDGTGVEAGLRWFRDGTELGLSVEYSRLDGFGGFVEDQFWGANVVAVAPVTDRVGVTFRIERSYSSGDFFGDADVDTYLAGMRVGF
jgi:hypothetical protein